MLQRVEQTRVTDSARNARCEQNRLSSAELVVEQLQHKLVRVFLDGDDIASAAQVPAKTPRQSARERLERVKAAAQAQRRTKRGLHGTRGERVVLLRTRRQTAEQRVRQQLRRGADAACVAQVGEAGGHERHSVGAVARVVVAVAELIKQAKRAAERRLSATCERERSWRPSGCCRSRRVAARTLRRRSFAFVSTSTATRTARVAFNERTPRCFGLSRGIPTVKGERRRVAAVKGRKSRTEELSVDVVRVHMHATRVRTSVARGGVGIGACGRVCARRGARRRRGRARRAAAGGSKLWSAAGAGGRRRAAAARARGRFSSRTSEPKCNARPLVPLHPRQQVVTCRISYARRCAKRWVD
jgi:hypothetical protein